MTQQGEPEQFLSKAELAERLGGRSERTLANWRAKRIGPPFVRAGRTILYRRSSFEAWLIANERSCGGVGLELVPAAPSAKPQAPKPRAAKRARG
jgi:aromatic ring-cleaving dioxygenase